MAALALMPAAVLALSGCWTSPAVISAPTGSPSLVGATILVESFKSTMTVQSVNPSQRKVVLQRKDGTTVTCKVGPEVANFAQLQAGDRVKATVADEFGIFLVKNGPQQADGYTWWYLVAPYDSTRAGWAAANFLAVVPSP